MSDVMEEPRQRKARIAAAALEFGAVFLGLGGLFWAIVQLSVIWSPGPTGSAVVTAVAWSQTVNTLAALLGIWAGALLLWGVGEAVRQLDNVQLALAGTTDEEVIQVQPVAMPTLRSATGLEQQSLAELRDILIDIRNLTLLSDEQRAERFEIQGRELLRELEAEVPQMLREHKFVHARERLAEAQARFPSIPEWQGLAQQIEAARERIESHDIESATRQINDLMALGAWDRILETVRDLVRRHPGVERVEELAHRVTAQGDKARQAERSRLLAQAQAATDRKDWTEALNLANQLINGHPKSVEAEALRQQLPTLRDNVEIQQRQRMEGQIRELIKEQQYAEGLAMARKLIERYPGSPQAAVLKAQLPRLEERAMAQQI